MDLLVNSFCCFSVWHVMIKMCHKKKKAFWKIPFICQERRRALAAQSPGAFSGASWWWEIYLSCLSSPPLLPQLPAEWRWCQSENSPPQQSPASAQSLPWHGCLKRGKTGYRELKINVKNYTRPFWKYWERFATLYNPILRGILPHNQNKPFVNYSQPRINAQAQTSGCTSITIRLFFKNKYCHQPSLSSARKQFQQSITNTQIRLKKKTKQINYIKT